MENGVSSSRTLARPATNSPLDATSALQRLSPAERTRVLTEWNATRRDYPLDRCVHQLFEAQVSRAPEATALVFGEARLSYGGLNARANQLAHVLRARGVGRDTLVAVAVERGIEMIVALLGVLKAGGAYVPMAPDAPAERLAFMLSDAKPLLLLTDAATRFDEAGIDIPVISLDTLGPQLAECPQTNPASEGYASSQLAYVIYTSGTTGTPKGVLVSQRNLVNFCYWCAEACALGAGDRITQFAPFTFDASAGEIFGGLLAGAELHLLDEATIHDPAALQRYLTTHAIQFSAFPPAYLQQMAPDAAPAGFKLLTAGSAPTPALVKRWAGRGHYLNGYGPTETTILSTSTWLSAEADTITIGRPIANTQVYLLDAHRQPVPIGVVGEIHIGGAGVALGYLNRPELTAELFLDDPFSAEADARMYRTGDLGRWMADGTIEFLGRNDFQVKIRGFRIELGEIEASLAGCEGVDEAVVIAREDGPGEPQLVAYYLGDQDVAAGSLREHLSKRLPEYMLPSAFVRLETWPLTANGKLDRKALPVPGDDAYARRAYAAPEGEIEQALARIWSELLGIERVGRDDNFFELGGHSLLAISVVEAMRRQGLHTDIATLLTASTLAALAADVSRENHDIDVPPNLIPAHAAHITPEMLPLLSLSQAQIDTIVAATDGGVGNLQDIYPLSPLQEGMLFHHTLAEHGDIYLLASLLAFADRQRLDSFLSAMQQVIARHDVLRTGIVWAGLEMPVQVVRRQVALAVEEIALDPADGEIARQLEARYDPRHCRVDLRHAPLLRLYVAYDAAHRRWLVRMLAHHIVMDHMGFELMLDEVRAIERGQADTLPPSMPYRNFVAQARLDADQAGHEAFFREMLSDVTEPTAPFGVMEVHGGEGALSAANRMLDASQSEAIRRHCRRLGIGPGSFMHLAWALVLARTTGRGDIVFGTVLFGRMRGGAHADRALGLFINSLPVRIEVGEADVEVGLKRAHAALARLMRHEHAPLALAQRCSGIAGQAPLFTSLMNYRYSEQHGPYGAGSGIELVSESERTNYAIDLSVDDFGVDFGIVISAQHGIDADRLCGYMQGAISGLVDALEHRSAVAIWAIDVLPRAETDLIVQQWNDTTQDYPRDLCVHQLFEAQAARTPEATALVFGEEAISYDELNRRANRLAHHLRTLGVVPDDRVAICVERSIEMVVGLLGILKAGGAYVPLEPTTPAARIAYVLADSAPVAVLVYGLGREAVRPHLSSDVPVLDLQRDQDQWRLQPDGDIRPGAFGLTSRHLAYVIYTSGTTGTPKGVMIEHASVTARAVYGITRYAITPQDRCLQFASFGFDASVTPIFSTLAGGAALIVRGQTLWSPDDVAEQIGRHRISIADVPTSYLEGLLTPDSQRAMRDLRILIIGGEAALSEILRSKKFDQTILNEYGPTEATVAATNFAVPPHAAIAHDTMYLPIGRPISNTSTYLLDERGVPVPIGVVGELYIGGAGVARGYLNQPGLTAERFLDDPFSAHAAARMYRTGDLGRWMADGNIEYLGRNDFQVKIRGFRIELGEIEATLAACEGVREAVVIARDDGPGEKHLVAYYLSDRDLSAASLREQLAAHLPAYMVPVAFVSLLVWPLTTNGKLDRRALPAPEGDAFASRTYEAPVGEVEQALATIWAALLKLERVGRHDNFFELGGHSLLAVQLVSRFRSTFNLEVPLRELFDFPVLSQLALRLDVAESSQLSMIGVVDHSGPMPLSLSQQRLWILTQIDGASAASHMGGTLRLSGTLNRPALERGFQRIVDRHEALRTQFVLVDGQPMQVIMAEARIVPCVRDLRGQNDRERICRESNDALMASPFDLRHDLPLRVQLIRLEDDTHELQVVMHHIVSDGWSIAIMLDELSRLYAADIQGQADPLPALPIQYADYAVWQRQWLAEGQLTRQIAFWQRNLAGAPTLLELPTDRRRPAQQDFLGDALDIRLDAALTADLNALSQRHGVTLYMTLLASWAAVLGRLSNQDEVVIGSPVAGRNRAEIESLIGFFVNTIAFRIDLSGEPTTGTLLARTQRQVLDAQAHQDLPFDQVVDAVKPLRSMGHSPIFQAMLAWQNQAEGRLEMPGMTVSSVDILGMTAQFDLTLNLGEFDGEIAGVLNYATALFDRETVERYAGYWRRLLFSMVGQSRAEASTRSISTLPILSADERSLMLDGWNDSARDYPLQACVHQLFEAQVSRAPEATALVFGEARLSYGGLNARANQLAHVLRARGVGRDTLVAVAVERGIEMIVALLGVLKAGGAYVPMAPDAPAERLAFMLSDAKPLLLLTDAATRFDEAGIDIPVISLDTLGPQLGQCPQTNPGGEGYASSQLAYVIYTSGTTGTPKGVLVSQRNLVNFCYWCQDVGLFKARERMTQFAPFTFDASAGEIFGGLLAGAESHLLDEATIHDPAALQRYLTTHAIQFSAFPPAYLQQMDPDAAPPGFKLLTAGSAPTPALVKRWAGRGHYLNGYGPTETTILSTSTWLSAEADTITIGRPIANTQVYLLDAHRQPVPIGVVGEIHIGGAGVARGYLNRPELTSERFLDDPFSAEADARMYRTGDLGRWMADGTIEFLGRNDFQVKIRGFRIELGEIEASLAGCEGVDEAVVIARDDGPGEPQLVAYYLGDQDVAAGSLREHLSKRLPEYMLPSAFVRLETWPLTANGKLDRKALPVPGDAAYARRAYLAPEGEIEQALARIWSELLGIERIGRDDNFFELGGHSLLAVQLMSRLHNVFHVEVPLRAVFESPTLSQLTEKIEQADASQLSAIAVVEREAHMPLSLAQQRLWVLTQIDGASAAYHMGGALKLEGALDRQALERAFQHIVDRHEALRTRFVLVDGQPMQAIMAEARIAPTLHDLRGQANRDIVCRELNDAFMAKPFDLRHDLPLRVQLIQLEASVHELQVVVHHIVSDGWSIGIILSELSRLYAADVLGRIDPLPALPIQYVDYSQWQRQWLAEGQLARQIAFWQHNLAGAPTLLELPTDRRRPAQQDFAGDVLDVRLDTALTADLKALSQRHGVTLYMTLLASWAAMLCRLSNQDEVVIGSPVAGRNRAEIESLIGFFVNTVAFRIDLSGEPTTSALLARTKRQVLEAQAHQDLPFDQVVDAVKPPRSMAHAPIFQAMLAWQNQAEARLEMPGLALSSAQTEATTAKFDVTLNLQERDEEIVGGLSYMTALFDRGTVARYAQYWIRLLQGMATDPALPIARLPMLDERERECVLDTWNQTGKAYPRDLQVHALFEAQAARTPEAIALSYGEQQLSYTELDHRANRLAHHLRESGVGPEDRVAICMERSFEMVVGLLGVLKAGGAYVPMDPASPQERLAYMIRDSAPVAILSHSSVGDRLSMATCPVLLLDTQWTQIAERSHATPHVSGLLSSHLAYVIYTSGSTGQPKAVMVEHHGLNNYLRWALETYAQGRAIDAVVSSPLVFDATITSLYIPLISGGCASLIRDGDELAGLESLLSTSDGFELIKITPAHLAATGQRLASQGIRPASKLFVVGGEALPATTVAQWRELSPDSTIVNEYGPTETVVGCVVHDTSAGGESGGNVPIGRPIANTRIYILDSQRQPVPMGVVGELYIGGAGVARGYLNQPGLTAERFLDDPFSAEPAARMYRTGDLGRWLPDGNIEYLGRNDFQVKIRGFRIELGEIEAALAACEGVREAAVIAREEVPGEKRLVAYYIADTMLDAGDLRQRLAQHLPDYMLPAAFVRIEAWPLTSNGKLDRKALPAPDDAAYARVAYAAPEGDVEETLAATWGELLKLDRVGREDNFFELGGHSLLAVQLISRLHKAFRVEVPLRAVFESPTLSQLADRIAQADASQLSAIAVVERETFMPLSLAQQRLWVLTQIDGASAAYHMGGALKLEGALDRDALQRALQRIVDRHEALRTQFVLVDGQPMQAIMAEARIVPSIHDLRDRVDREAACRSFSDAFMTTPFDLRHDLPLRVQLIQLEDHVHELQVVMHHIVSDGWSIGIMLNELSRLYAADVQGQADPLPALPIQYVDYSQWQRQWLADGQLVRQTTFWQHNLAGAPTLLELPTDRRRPAQQDFAGDAVEVRLDTALTAGLKALSQRHGVTLYMTLLASWAAVLGRLSNQDEVVIGSPVAGRNRAEIESLIGFFVNTVAFRIDLSGEPTTSTLLSRTQRQVLDAQAHQDLPFDQVVDAVKPPRSMAHAPIFQTMMTLNNQESAGLEMPGLEVSSVDAEAVTAKFDVMLDLQEHDGKIVGGLSYVTALFDRETVARYAQYWIRLLQGMVAEPELAVARLPMLNARERERVIGVWNQTAKTYPRDLRIHALFEAQVERTPEAIALSFGDQRLSYAELNRRANRVAHHLRAQGVKPDDRVAICTERSPEMVVAVLAVLKSGGAYVPLDPAFPRERLGQIIEDSTPVAALVDTHGQVVLEHSAGAALAGIVQVEVSSPRTFAECPEENLEHWPATTAAMHTAYVLFTSGSTGRPKGVCVSHRAAVNFLLSMAGTPGLRAEDTLCAITTLSFDIALLELLLPLTVGARVALADRATTIDAEALSALLEATETTVMQATPTTWRMLLDAGWRGRAGMRLLCGGEALPLDLAERLLTCGELWNMYGPTETTVWSMVERVVPGQSRITLGRPIANTRIYLLDARRQAVPIGVVGEIHIGGDGVALGYLGRPELTAERFLDDPFSVESDARMYRTGDLGRWLPDGTVEFLGRNDFQVKIRGFRIELGEIEATLSACPGVREAVVSAREDAPGDQRLVAYYLADTMLDAGDLRRLLSQHLPEYMLPAAFVRLEAWPLTSNGKLDRKALPAPEGDAYASRGYEAPQGRVETALARIWSELLGINRVGRHDNFFELGGNSIQLIRMIARLCDQRIRISLADVYRLGTVHGIAAVAVSASQTLAERLAEEGWPYELVTVGAADTGIAVLLVDAREPARLAKLRRLLSDEAAAEVAYVRVSADPLAEAERLRLHGLAALEIQTGIASTALAATLGAQLDRQRAQIEAAATVEAATVETYPFSAIQRNFQVWSSRDSIAHATAIGWYAPEALQAAFAALVREQDLLRSAADLSASRWRLLDAAAIGTALLPSIRLRPEPGLPVDAVFAQTLEVLTAARSRSPLAYAGAWISLSETEHHLCLSIDHLIWDGISEETLQRRLNALLREQSTPLVGSYRQFATEVECHGDRAIDARFDRRFDRAVVAATMAATSAVLAQRTALPLRSVTLSMPLTATHSPAEQAFECFRRWALRITALDRLGLVLTHHGRQRGTHGYFDHIGLFLDKIPFAVDIDTTLQTLTDTVGELQKQGLGYVAMERRACADGLMPTLPMISDEVLFNFQSRTMAENVDMPASSPQDLGARMGGYRGILFEGFAQSRQIIGNCLFRGSDEDMQALVDAFQGCTVIESMVVLTADTPSPAMRAFDIVTIE